MPPATDAEVERLAAIIDPWGFEVEAADSSCRQASARVKARDVLAAGYAPKRRTGKPPLGEFRGGARRSPGLFVNFTTSVDALDWLRFCHGNHWPDAYLERRFVTDWTEWEGT